MKDTNNKYLFTEEPMKRGRVNKDFIKKNNLIILLHLADWFKGFLVNKVDKTINMVLIFR